MSRHVLHFFNKAACTPYVYMVGPGFAAEGDLIPASSWQSGVKIIVFSSKHWMRIKLPSANYIGKYCLHVGSRVDVYVKCRINDNEWIIEFPNGSFFHETSPADINITIAPDESNEPDEDPEEENTGSN